MNRFENEGVVVVQWTLNSLRILYFNNDIENIMLIVLQ